MQKKSVKNLILRVKSSSEVVLTIPRRTTIEQGKDFVRKKVDWIKKQQNKYKSFESKKETTDFENGDIVYFLGNQYKLKVIPNEKNFIKLNNEYLELNIRKNYIENKTYISNTYDKLLREYAKKLFYELVIKYQSQMAKYRIKVPEIEIRKMKSRWGSCFWTKNKIVLNLSLIKVPLPCTEYVVVHELSHFKFQNHSKNFYNFISLFIPDWNERRRILNKEYGFVI